MSPLAGPDQGQGGDRHSVAPSCAVPPAEPSWRWESSDFVSLQAPRRTWVVASCCIDTANQRPSPPQGNPEEHTILEFAQLIKNLVGE